MARLFCARPETFGPYYVHSNTKWHYFNLNRAPLIIRGPIKIHKNNNPIRPIINLTNAPAYKLARKITKDLQKHIHLPNSFDVKNTVQLTHDITDIPYDSNIKLASFDITNMYTNIPTNELANIILNLRNNNYVDPTIRSEILHLCVTILQQNYFKFEDSFYIQNTGPAMGAPTSSILSEMYLQFLENTVLSNILIRHDILGYFRYVDDILVIYRENHTDIHEVLNLFNNATSTLQFTIEQENNTSMNFLDVTNNGLNFRVYRKPTATDRIIPRNCNHPPEHKQSAVNYVSTPHIIPPKGCGQTTGIRNH